MINVSALPSLAIRPFFSSVRSMRQFPYSTRLEKRTVWCLTYVGMLIDSSSSLRASERGALLLTKIIPNRYHEPMPNCFIISASLRASVL